MRGGDDRLTHKIVRRECFKAYIGKTKNTLYERFYGSNGHLHPSSSKSALLRHMDTNPLGEFEFDSIKILDKCEVKIHGQYLSPI